MTLLWHSDVSAPVSIHGVGKTLLLFCFLLTSASTLACDVCFKLHGQFLTLLCMLIVHTRHLRFSHLWLRTYDVSLVFKAYHLRREETDWFDKPRESRLENGHGFDRRLPDKLAHSRPPSQHQDQVSRDWYSLRKLVTHHTLITPHTKVSKWSSDGISISVVGSVPESTVDTKISKFWGWLLNAF